MNAPFRVIVIGGTGQVGGAAGLERQRDVVDGASGRADRERVEPRGLVEGRGQRELGVGVDLGAGVQFHRRIPASR